MTEMNKEVLPTPTGSSGGFTTSGAKMGFLDSMGCTRGSLLGWSFGLAVVVWTLYYSYSFTPVVLCDEPAFSPFGRIHPAGNPSGAILAWNTEGEDSTNPLLFSAEYCFLGLDLFTSCSGQGLPSVDNRTQDLFFACDLAPPTVNCTKANATAGDGKHDYTCTFNYDVTNGIIAEANADKWGAEVGQTLEGTMTFSSCEEDDVESLSGQLSVFSAKKFPDDSSPISTKISQVATCGGDALDSVAYMRSLTVTAKHVVESRKNIINPYREEALPDSCTVALTGDATDPLPVGQSFTLTLLSENKGC